MRLPAGALLLTGACALAAGTACSMRTFAINRLGNALAESGATYASDNDPTLVREALPFALKLIESLLDQSPRHPGLLRAAAGGFTQYTYAFVQEEADETEDDDLAAASLLRERARKLYLRARDYGLRGLQVRHDGLAEALRSGTTAAVAQAEREDVPLLYWTAAAWGGAIAMKKDDPELLADLPVVEALIKRGLALDPAFDHGAIHEFLIAFEGSRSEAMGGSIERARAHFREALRLSGGQRAAPLVDLAETVAVRLQDRAEFEDLLKRALAIDADARPEWRLANLSMQRRARWLLARADQLFVTQDPVGALGALLEVGSGR
jgi:predicted anti-sigma-YlaC factor YlaD